MRATHAESSLGASPAWSIGVEVSAQASPFVLQWFKAWATPAFVVLADLLMLAANTAAKQVLEQHSDIRLSEGRLFFAQDTQTEKFRVALEGLADIPLIWGFTRSGDSGHWVVRAQRVPSDQGRSVFGLTVTCTNSPQPRYWADLSVAFLLTPSEFKVATLLFEGYAVSALAQSMGVTVETARTHIRRIYQKTGASSREQLHSLLSQFQST